MWFPTILQAGSTVHSSLTDSLKSVLNTNIKDSTRLNIYLTLLATSKELDDLSAYAEKALMISKRMEKENPFSPFETQHKIGLAYSNVGRSKEAIEHFKAVLLLEDQTENGSILGKTHYQLGNNYKFIGQVDLAIEHLEKAISYGAALKDNKLMALSKSTLGTLYRDKGDFPTSLELLKEAASLMQSIEEGETLVSIYSNTGRSNRMAGNYDAAWTYYRKSLALAKKIDSKKGIAVAYNNLGNMHETANEYEKALENYINSLRIKEDIGDQRSISISYHNIGGVRSVLGNHEAAIKDYEKSMELAKAVDFKTLILFNDLKIGNAKKELGRPEEAVIHHQNAIKLAEEIDHQSGLTQGWVNLGEDYLVLNRFNESMDCFLKGLKIAEKIERKIWISYAHIGIVEVYTAHEAASKKRNDIPALKVQNLNIEKLLLRAHELAVELDDLTNITSTIAALRGYYEKKGNYEKEAAYSRMYIRYKDSLFHQQKADALADWETQYKTEEQGKEITLLEKENQLAAREKAFLSSRNRLYLLATGLLGLLLLIGTYLFYQLRKTKQKLEAKNIQLEQLNTTKDKFFGIIAHDIRSPIVALDGVGEQMDFYLKKGKTDKLERLARRVDSTAKRLSSLLDNLLNWALLQQGVIPYHPKSMSVSEIVQSTMNMFQDNAEAKGVVLQSEIPAEQEVYADESAMRTILRNLVSNAIKFTPTGGIVSISTETKADKIFININDTGTGISAEKINRLFTLEKQSEQGTAGEKGTGLGLTLVKELAELNKGLIEVSSVLGKGSRFGVGLPLAV